MELEGKVYRVFGADYTDTVTSKVPGSVVSADNRGLEIACAEGATLLITQLQAPGKKRMSAADFLRGHKIKVD
jgi:methionyl-tRNA formyltransferase